MKPSKLASFLLAALLVLGLYFPTSREGVILKELQFVFSGVLFLLLVPMLVRPGGALGSWAVPNSMAINGILFLATIVSPFTAFAYGAFVPVLLLSMVLCLRIKDLFLTRLHGHLFAAAHLVNLIGGALIILQQTAVLDFVRNNYAAAYPELVASMLAAQKPVLMFHSHSVAAFYFYLFFYLTFRAYMATHSRLNLLLAIGYLLLVCWVNSFTAYAVLAVALVQVCLGLGRSRGRALSLMAGMALTGFVAVELSGYSPEELWWRVTDTLASPANGLQGRYSESGGLRSNLEYLSQHPFSPIGLGYSEGLIYGDSGPVTFLIRGSVPLLLAVYGGLFLFFWKNLRSHYDAVWLFVVYLGFEIGYGNLEYLRTQYLLPLLVIYLNSLPGAQEASASQPALCASRGFQTALAHSQRAG